MEKFSQALLKLGLIFALACLAVIGLQKPHKAEATINRQINFQGKIVLNSNSTNISNGTYNMEFKLYSGGDGVLGGGDETLLWTEDRLVGGTGGISITDGIFQANLGSVTSLPGSVDFNASTIWLSMQIGNTSGCTITVSFQSNCGGDTEMTPFVRFTAAPYAFNADLLDGIDSTAFGQLASNQTWTGTQTLQPTTNITTAIIKQTSGGSPTADIFNLQTANATNILQVTGPAANEAAVTLASVGATRDLTLDSASGTLKLGSNTTTLQKSGTAFTFDVNSGSNSTLTITNAGAGTASLSVEGNVTAGGTLFANTIDRSSAGLLSVGTGGASNATSIAVGSSSVTGITFTTDNNATNDIQFTGGATFNNDVDVAGHLAIGSGSSPSGAAIVRAIEIFDSSDNCGFGCYGLQSFPTLTNPASPARGVGLVTKVSTGAASFTLSEADGVIIQDPGLGAGSSITTNIGLRIDPLTNGTSDYAISLGGADTADILFDTDRTHVLKVQDQDTGATAGSALQITGANGNTSGAGGDISITSGNGGGTGASNAGTITINNGTLSGAGTATINIGTSNTTALNLGNSATTTSVTGGLSVSADDDAAFSVKNAAGTSTFKVNTGGLSLTNLIPFPSFENGNSNGWTVHGTGTGASVVASTDFANFGSYSLKVITGTTASGTEYRYPLKASTQYSLSFWARLSSGSSASGEFNAGRNDNPGSLGTATGDTACTTTPDISLTAAVTTAWTQYTCTFTTGATIGPSSNIYMKQTDTTTSTLYIDGITLVQASAGLSFTPIATGLDFNNYDDSLVLNGNASGELQPWRLNDKPIGATTSTDTTNRVFGHEGSATITANGYVYVLGGYNGTNTLNSVSYAKVNADGSVGTWSCQGTAAATSCGTSASPTNANSLPAARRLLTAVLANGYIYAIGGFDGSASASTVYYAKLNGDGSTGTWQTNTYGIGQAVAGTAQARVAPSAAVLNGYIYVVGGCSDAAAATCATPQSTVYYAKVNADGSTNAWTTNANALTAAKGMGTIAIANGYMYYIGGATNATTVSGNVYCAAISSDGSIGSFATTSCNSIPSNRAQQATFVLNGFLYVIGGCSVIASASCTTATNTVWYAPLNGDGTLGTWVVAASTLPANRGAPSYFIGNSYVYMLGGYDASTRQSTIYYTSTPRTFIAGGLDLIGLNSQTTSDAGGGGNLTAGNTSIVGALRVDGYADFNNGISVDSALNVNAVSAMAGQTIFNINNSSANSIFNVRHMGTNFGSLVTGGAFMQKNSYFGEEFNISPVNASQTCLANATETNAGWSRGDLGSHNNAAITCGTSLDQFSGEFNWSTKNGTTGAAQGCTVAYQNAGTANGVERISAASIATASNTASCTEALAATRTTSNKIFLAANLPVATYKVKASTLTASQNADRIRIGLSNVNTATAMGSPTDGIYFSNCSTESTTTGSVSGCSNTTWYGHSFSGSAEVSGGPVTCSAGSGSNALTSNFSYLRIEVRATNDVHFYADYNTSDGINEVECGTGIGTASTSAALTTWTHVTVATNAARTVAADIDYIRIWQDDNVPIESVAPENTTETPSGEDIVTTSPLTSNDINPEDPESSSDLYSFSAASSEDAMFEKDVYIKGTLFADKVKANQIEGLEVLTDKINSLSAAQKTKSKDSSSPVTTALSASQDNPSSLDNVTIKQASVTLNLDVGGTLLAGGLTLNGPAEFNGDSIFNKLVTFVGDINVTGRARFNNDTGGFATIYAGQQEVKVKFTKEYSDTPIVTVSIKNGQFGQYAIKELDSKGFTIVLKDPAENETQFTWTALSVKDAQTTQVLPAAAQ